MRNMIAITQVSLDGVMQGPGGPEEDRSNGFTLGGWAMKYVDDEASQVIGETFRGEFDLLLGRRTYDLWAGYWPKQVDHPIGKAFNKATKFVATRGQRPLEWKTSRRLGVDAVAELKKLKATSGPPLHLWGSSNLLQALSAAELIDEHRLWVFPVVLGRGKRLFEPGARARELSLVSCRSTKSGVVFSTYRAARSR